MPTVILEFHLQAILRVSGAEFPDLLDMPIQFDPFLSDRRAERSRLFGAQGRLHLIEVFDQRFRALRRFKDRINRRIDRLRLGR
jgi:hypothetical protein